jgi:enoyl-CoA hydratase/carnithine racemase
MPTFNSKSDLLDIRINGPVAIIKITGDVYQLITNLDQSENFIHVLTQVNQDNNLKALLLLNDKEVYSEKAYNSFMETVVDTEPTEIGFPVIREGKLNFLFNQVINRLIRRIIDFKKLFVVGLQGEVVSPFFGSSLAADFKFGSDKFSFLLAHQKFGLHPGGALPYFLSKFLHHSKATEILLRHSPIYAEEALQLGLINDIVDEHNFEEACLERTLAFCSGPACTLHFTKRLLNFTRKDLSDYIDFETQLLNL